MTSVVSAGAQLRVVLLHPQRIWAETLESMLDGFPGIEIVLSHTTYHWAWSAVARGEADVALLGADTSLVVQQVEELRKASSGIAVVVISDSTDADLIAATVRAGARGWVRPSATSRQLVQTLQGVHCGETWFPPDVTTAALESLLNAEKARSSSQEAISRLSDRELQILECLAQGMTRDEIGERFQLSPHTVRTHINHVLRKLEVHSTLAAVSLANKSRRV